MLNNNLVSDLEQLKKEIWYIKKTLIPSLQTQISNSGGGNTSELTSQLTALQTRVTTLEGQVSTLQSSVSGNTTNISSLTTDLSGLTTRVTTLENSGGSGSGGENIDVIYDMRSNDAAINRGYPNGMVGSKIIRMDFSVYNKLRIYASLNGCDTQYELKLAERNATSFFMSSMNSAYNTVNFQRFVLNLTLTAFQVSGYAIYSYDLTNGNALTVSKGSLNTSFFMYRLEGVK